MAKGTANKIRKRIANIVGVFVPTKKARSYVRGLIYHPDFRGRWARFWAGREMWRAECNRRRNGYKYPYELAVVAIMKNEGPYLREWIEYHRIVGMEKFYLYNNDSTDDTVEILKPYVDSGVVELIDFPGERKQLPAYADCIARHKMDARWLAVIDLDEFIVPDSGGDKITDVLNMQSRKVSQVLARWVMYGSNGHVEKPAGLVVESYTKRAKKQTWHYKAIINPRLVHRMDCHSHLVVKRTVELPTRVMRINHYFCKSWAEYSKRAGRGDAYNGANAAVRRYTREFFDKRDTNDIEDRIMDKYLVQLKKGVS